MALTPITDKDGNQTDLQAVTDSVIATKAFEIEKQVVGELLQQATNEFVQGVNVAAEKDPDPVVDIATAESVDRMTQAEAERDARLALLKTDVTPGWAEAKTEHLTALAKAWEQDYAGHQAHITLAESDEQVKASTIAMLVIEGAHEAAKAEIDKSGELAAKAAEAVAKAGPRVQAIEAAKQAFDEAVVSEIFEVAERMTGPRRPGRAGRGDDHYAEVLRRYRQLKAKGETQPIVALQRIYGEEWSRDTIAGWVKRAKKIEQERQAEAGKGHRP